MSDSVTYINHTSESDADIMFGDMRYSNIEIGKVNIGSFSMNIGRRICLTSTNTDNNRYKYAFIDKLWLDYYVDNGLVKNDGFDNDYSDPRFSEQVIVSCRTNKINRLLGREYPLTDRLISLKEYVKESDMFDQMLYLIMFYDIYTYGSETNNFLTIGDVTNDIFRNIIMKKDIDSLEFNKRLITESVEYINNTNIIFDIELEIVKNKSISRKIKLKKYYE